MSNFQEDSSIITFVKVDCTNDKFTISYHEECLSDFYKYLKWQNFYIGDPIVWYFLQVFFQWESLAYQLKDSCKLVETSDKSVDVLYTDCNTQVATESDHIVYSNQIQYLSVDGLNFFASFDVKCKVEKTVSTQVPCYKFNFFYWSLRFQLLFILPISCSFLTR